MDARSGNCFRHLFEHDHHTCVQPVEWYIQQSESHVYDWTPNVRVLISSSVNDSSGETILYCSNGQGYNNCALPNQGYAWISARIFGYDAAMNGLKFTQTNKAKMYSHEMGHVLAMDHVYANVNAVMIQGPMVIGVQQYDKDDFKSRWGN